MSSARSCLACHTPLPDEALACGMCGTPTPVSSRVSPGAPASASHTARTGADDPAFRERLAAALGAEYELRGRVGGGGFAEVFVAADRRLKRLIAVKVLRPRLALDADLVRRFRREAESVAQLRHAHIVPIFSVGESDGVVFYTMPLVSGETLGAHLRREGRLEIAGARRILYEVASALSAAHRAGIVHRDVKPENVMLEGAERSALLMDFGIAKSLAPMDGDVTGTGVVLGTPRYMSPEQVTGDRLTDHRSDLYSLGVVAYEMLAGRTPFQGRSPGELLKQLLTATPPELRELRPDVPPELSAVVMRCLSRAAEDRPQSAADVVHTLAASWPAGITPPRSPAITPPGGAGAALPHAAVATPSGTAAAPPRRWSRRALAAAALAGLTVAGSALAVKAWRRADVPVRGPVDARAVAIIPFSVREGDPSVSRLRDDVPSLLYEGLADQTAVRVMDRRALQRAWSRRIRPGDDDPSLPVVLQLAGDVRAGQVVIGEIVPEEGAVRGRTSVRIDARLIDAATGQTRASSTVRGAADSAVALCDTLADHLFELGSTQGQQRLALLRTARPRVLRAYLDGRLSYVRGRNENAVRYFEEALDADSSFILAALALIQSSNWVGLVNQAGERGLRLAWAEQAQLGARDRAYLRAAAGPDYPAVSSMAAQIEAWDAAAEAAEDRQEVWFDLGEHLYLYGQYLGLSNWRARARSAFSRALALDSSFVAPMERLLDLAVQDGDLPRARRMVELIFRADSAPDRRHYLRWRLAVAARDASALAGLRSEFASAGESGLTRLITTAQLEGIALADADAAIGAVESRAATEGEQALVSVGRYLSLMNRGRPREAAPHLSASVGYLVHLRTLVLAQAIRDAVFEAGDSVAARAAAARLERTIREIEAYEDPAPLDHAFLYAAHCGADLWRVARGEAATSIDLVPRLRRLAASFLPLRIGGGNTPIAGAEPTCPAVLDAMLAAAQRRPDAAEALDRLDALMARGPMDADAPIGNLAVARLRVAQGDTLGALRALRRRPNAPLGLIFLAASLRQEGRLAAALGEHEAAARAYRHYLALRTAPEPSVRPQVDSVRRELAALGADAAGRGTP